MEFLRSREVPGGNVRHAAADGSDKGIQVDGQRTSNNKLYCQQFTLAGMVLTLREKRIWRKEDLYRILGPEQSIYRQDHSPFGSCTVL